MASQVLQAEAIASDIITSSETELRRHNPDVDRDVIHSLVRASYDRLTPAKVRTYLPILVVREVNENLRTH